MSVEDIKQQIAVLTPPEYQEIWDFVVSEEHDRRRSEKYAAQVVEELQESGQLEKTEAVTEDEAKAGAAKVPEWRDPGTRHDLMYHYGDVVRHNGKLVRSTHDGLNSWEPGTLGFDGRIWEVVDESETSDTSDESETSETPENEENPETTDSADTPTDEDGPEETADPFVQPTSETPYGAGDKVLYNGAVWESTIPNNVWSPDAYPQGWKKL